MESKKVKKINFFPGLKQQISTLKNYGSLNYLSEDGFGVVNSLVSEKKDTPVVCKTKDLQPFLNMNSYGFPQMCDYLKDWIKNNPNEKIIVRIHIHMDKTTNNKQLLIFYFMFCSVAEIEINLVNFPGMWLDTLDIFSETYIFGVKMHRDEKYRNCTETKLKPEDCIKFSANYEERKGGSSSFNLYSNYDYCAENLYQSSLFPYFKFFACEDVIKSHNSYHDRQDDRQEKIKRGCLFKIYNLSVSRNVEDDGELLEETNKPSLNLPLFTLKKVDPTKTVEISIDGDGISPKSRYELRDRLSKSFKITARSTILDIWIVIFLAKMKLTFAAKNKSSYIMCTIAQIFNMFLSRQHKLPEGGKRSLLEMIENPEFFSIKEKNYLEFLLGNTISNINVFLNQLLFIYSNNSFSPEEAASLEYFKPLIEESIIEESVPCASITPVFCEKTQLYSVDFTSEENQKLSLCTNMNSVHYSYPILLKQANNSLIAELQQLFPSLLDISLFGGCLVSIMAGLPLKDADVSITETNYASFLADLKALTKKGVDVNCVLNAEGQISRVSFNKEFTYFGQLKLDLVRNFIDSKQFNQNIVPPMIFVKGCRVFFDKKTLEMLQRGSFNLVGVDDRTSVKMGKLLSKGFKLEQPSNLSKFLRRRLGELEKEIEYDASSYEPNSMLKIVFDQEGNMSFSTPGEETKAEDVRNNWRARVRKARRGSDEDYN